MQGERWGILAEPVAASNRKWWSVFQAQHLRLQAYDWPRNESFILGLDLRAKQNKNLEDLFFHFAMAFFLTSAKETRGGHSVGFLTRMAEANTIFPSSLLHFPNCIHFHFMTHSDNLLCLKLPCILPARLRSTIHTVYTVGNSSSRIWRVLWTLCLCPCCHGD